MFLFLLELDTDLDLDLDLLHYYMNIITIVVVNYLIHNYVYRLQNTEKLTQHVYFCKVNYPENMHVATLHII